MRCRVLKGCSKGLPVFWRRVNHEVAEAIVLAPADLRRSLGRDYRASPREDRGARGGRHARGRKPRRCAPRILPRHADLGGQQKRPGGGPPSKTFFWPFPSPFACCAERL